MRDLSIGVDLVLDAEVLWRLVVKESLNWGSAAQKSPALICFSLYTVRTTIDNLESSCGEKLAELSVLSQLAAKLIAAAFSPRLDV